MKLDKIKGEYRYEHNKSRLRYGVGGEVINQALTGSAPNWSGSISVQNGYVHVATPSRYYTSFMVFQIENGVCTALYAPSAETYSYNNGTLSVSLTDVTSAYGTPYFKGYMTS